MPNQSYKELFRKKLDLENAINRLRSDKISEVRTLIRDFDIQLHELYDKHNNSSSNPNRIPKYRDPKTGATWTGLGKAPRWITGRDRTPFLINSSMQRES